MPQSYFFWLAMDGKRYFVAVMELIEQQVIREFGDRLSAAKRYVRGGRYDIWGDGLKCVNQSSRFVYDGCYSRPYRRKSRRSLEYLHVGQYPTRVLDGQFHLYWSEKRFSAVVDVIGNSEVLLFEYGSAPLLELINDQLRNDGLVLRI